MQPLYAEAEAFALSYTYRVCGENTSKALQNCLMHDSFFRKIEDANFPWHRRQIDFEKMKQNRRAATFIYYAWHPDEVYYSDGPNTINKIQSEELEHYRTSLQQCFANMNVDINKLLYK